MSGRRPVVLLHEHAGVREFLRRLINESDFAQVVDEATDSAMARKLLDRMPYFPVVVANPILPPAGAFDLNSKSCRHMVMYTDSSPSDFVLSQCLRLSASIVSGQDEVREVQAVLQNAVECDSPQYSSSISQRLADSQNRHTKLKALSPKQIAIMLLIAKGFTVKGTAIALGLSAKSVDSHLWRLKSRLGIRDRANLTMYCLKEGLLNCNHEGAFVCRCPSCNEDVPLGIAQWLRAGHEETLVTCYSCSHEWVCEKSEMRSD